MFTLPLCPSLDNGNLVCGNWLIFFRSIDSLFTLFTLYGLFALVTGSIGVLFLLFYKYKTK